MKVAVVGVTGLVGQVMLRILEERNFPVTELVPVASSRSVGKEVHFARKSYSIKSLEEGISERPDIALFSAGANVSRQWAPKFTDLGTFVIDNSSAWRMDDGVPLIVPEVNAHAIKKDNRLIANPNCSTIQMVVALNPLHKKYHIKRLVISTYQSFTGTGQKAVDQYVAERHGQKPKENAYPHPIFENCLPHCDVFFDSGYTKEEMKLVHETRKILNDENLRITATAVRVPVHGGHSESVNVEFEDEYDLDEVRNLLRKSEGVVVQDDIHSNLYPMPFFAKDRDDVFVGRIRRDNSADHALNMWIVSDNLRKGAATNAVQIAEYLIKSEIVRVKQETSTL